MPTFVFRFLTFLVAFVSPLAAETLTEQQLQTFLKDTTTLTATFQQQSIAENGMISKTSQGEFYLSRPGKFRWNYQQPFIQQIISDGHKVWFYDADLEQVTIKTLDDSIGSTPALLLSGNLDLNENFTLEEQIANEGQRGLKLIPKTEDSGFHYILIRMDNNGISGMELSDNFGQLTRVFFSDLVINQPIENTLFDFTPPPGVDIFDNH